MKKEKGWYQVSLKVIMKNKKGEILGLKAIDRSSYRGYYDFPGGRIDAEEFQLPFEEIIRRELKEEIGEVFYKLHPVPVALGRHIIPAQFSSGGKDIQVMYIFYEAEYLRGKIVVNHEHIDFQWLRVSCDNLEKYFISGILEGMRIYLAARDA